MDMQKVKDRIEALKQELRNQEHAALFQSPNGIPQGPFYLEYKIRLAELEELVGVQENQNK